MTRALKMSSSENLQVWNIWLTPDYLAILFKTDWKRYYRKFASWQGGWYEEILCPTVGYTFVSEIDEILSTHRYRFFSKFDDGIQLDRGMKLRFSFDDVKHVTRVMVLCYSRKDCSSHSTGKGIPMLWLQK